MATKLNASTKIEEARDLCRRLLDRFDKESVTALARQCEHIGRLIGDDFIVEYASKCLSWASSDNQVNRMIDWLRSAGTTARASGALRALEDFKTGGPSIEKHLMSGKTAQFTFCSKSLPECEAFVKNARRKYDYRTAHSEIMESIEQTEAVLERVRRRLHRYASKQYLKLRFGSIPESIVESTRALVDARLAKVCPAALEKFSVAYEELAQVSPENWSNACLGIRRILVDVADAVYPPKSEPVDGHDVGAQNYMNRLWAYAAPDIQSDRDGEILRAELEDVGARLDALNDLANKGVHRSISKASADRLVIRTYLALADIFAIK